MTKRWKNSRPASRTDPRFLLRVDYHLLEPASRASAITLVELARNAGSYAANLSGLRIAVALQAGYQRAQEDLVEAQLAG